MSLLLAEKPESFNYSLWLGTRPTILDQGRIYLQGPSTVRRLVIIKQLSIIAELPTSRSNLFWVHRRCSTEWKFEGKKKILLTKFTDRKLIANFQSIAKKSRNPIVFFFVNIPDRGSDRCAPDSRIEHTDERQARGGERRRMGDCRVRDGRGNLL